MEAEISAGKVAGLDCLVVENASLRVAVIPQWGGKIASIVDKERGREWLHRNPWLDYRLPSYGASYTAAFDVGGFDECLPNIAEGAFPDEPWRGVPLPDHGEVWALPWEVQSVANGLSLTTSGIRLPYRFRRRLFLQGSSLQLEYCLENPAPFPLPFLWSSHPTFAVHPGMRIVAERGVARVDTAVGAFPAVAGERFCWPQCGDDDLSILPDPSSGFAAKLHLLEPQGGRISLADPQTRAQCILRFDPKEIPQIGIWMNYRGWAGAPGADPYYCVAIEPCIGGSDRLDTAYEEGTAGSVPAFGERRWRLALEFSNYFLPITD